MISIACVDGSLRTSDDDRWKVYLGAAMHIIALAVFLSLWLHKLLLMIRGSSAANDWQPVCFPVQPERIPQLISDSGEPGASSILMFCSQSSPLVGELTPKGFDTVSNLRWFISGGLPRNKVVQEYDSPRKEARIYADLVRD